MRHSSFDMDSTGLSDKVKLRSDSIICSNEDYSRVRVEVAYYVVSSLVIDQQSTEPSLQKKITVIWLISW